MLTEMGLVPLSLLAQITDADDDDDHDEGTENDVFQGSHDIHGLEDGLIDASNDLSVAGRGRNGKTNAVVLLVVNDGEATKGGSTNDGQRLETHDPVQHIHQWRKES